MGGADPQVKAHVQGNLNVGNNRQVLLDTVTQLLPYIGYPRSLNGITAINEIAKELIMSKKVLILSGSFRKHGNSDLLCDEFKRGAEEAGHSVEKIFINEKQIHYCRGCGVCNSTHKCVIKDDMAEILDKMVKADVIVMATPV